MAQTELIEERASVVNACCPILLCFEHNIIILLKKRREQGFEITTKANYPSTDPPLLPFQKLTKTLTDGNMSPE
jgi:hypothetical protein